MVFNAAGRSWLQAMKDRGEPSHPSAPTWVPPLRVGGTTSLPGPTTKTPVPNESGSGSSPP